MNGPSINLALQEAEERNNAEDISVLGMCGTGGVVNPSTQVFYVCQQYSLVFVLDMSNNMRSVVSEAESMRWGCRNLPCVLEQLQLLCEVR